VSASLRWKDPEVIRSAMKKARLHPRRRVRRLEDDDVSHWAMGDIPLASLEKMLDELTEVAQAS